MNTRCRLWILAGFGLGCATSSPRVLDVSRPSHTLQRLTIHWSAPATIERVVLEYRQVQRPNHIEREEFTTNRAAWWTFRIPAAEQAGGELSAWRVTLWRGDELLAEKRSVLW